METPPNWIDGTSHIQKHTHYRDEIDSDEPDSVKLLSFIVDHGFSESRCLFCNHFSSNLDQSLVHMSKPTVYIQYYE
jgi:hypothetical protein